MSKKQPSMLLLLLQLKEFNISFHFEILQGITPQQQPDLPENKLNKTFHYKLLNLSGFNPCTRGINEASLPDYQTIKEISPEKVLQENDYLIACKGEVRGYSMVNSKTVMEELKKHTPHDGIVASNHFLILRTRMRENMESSEIRFLHNVMDILIPELRKLGSSKTGAAKYLTINEVANFRFNYPGTEYSEIEKFDAISIRYLEKLHEFEAVKKELDIYNRDLAWKIIK